MVYSKLLPVQLLMKVRNTTINSSHDSHPLVLKLNQKHMRRRKPDFWDAPHV
jgi:hypothetical protein